MTTPAAYKLRAVAGVSSLLRVADGASVPLDPSNVDYKEFQRWLAAGNQPDPADPVVIPPRRPTPLDWFLRLPLQTQASLDVAARTDTAVSLALRYASGVNEIDVTDPRTIANVTLLFNKGLLTQPERDLLLQP